MVDKSYRPWKIFVNLSINFKFNMISMNSKLIRLPNVAISQRTTPKDQLSNKAQRDYNNVQIYCRLYLFLLLSDRRTKKCEMHRV